MPPQTDRHWMIPEPASAATAPGPVVRVRERGRGEWSFTGQSIHTVEILQLLYYCVTPGSHDIMLRTLVLAIHTYIYMCSKDDVFQTVSLFFLVVLTHTHTEYQNQK